MSDDFTMNDMIDFFTKDMKKSKWKVIIMDDEEEEEECQTVKNVANK